MVATFAFSAFLHELLLMVMFQMFRPWLLVIMMLQVLQLESDMAFNVNVSHLRICVWFELQIPLIELGRLPFFRNRPTLANLCFWVGMLIGLPIISAAYTQHYCSVNVCSVALNAAQRHR